MTPQEVIKYFKDEIIRLKNAPVINGCKMTEEWEEQIKICEEAIFAIEKQIPKKPIIHGVRDRDINTISYTCPVCNKHIDIDNYCKHCGQALDWSEEE